MKISLLVLILIQLSLLTSCNDKGIATSLLKSCNSKVPTDEFFNSTQLYKNGTDYFFGLNLSKDFREDYKSLNDGCSVVVIEVNVVKGRFSYIYDREEQGVALISSLLQIEGSGEYQLSVSNFENENEISLCSRTVSNLDEASSFRCKTFSIDSAQDSNVVVNNSNDSVVYNSRYCISTGEDGTCVQYANYSISNINSQYSFGGVSLNQVQQENPCILSGPEVVDQSVFNRQVVTARVSVPYIVSQGDMYVGVTSLGDVAAIIGDGTTNPTFVAYLCPRPSSGQAILFPQILLGNATDCAVKYITAANMTFPDGTQANFRALSPGGSSLRQRFSFCQR